MDNEKLSGPGIYHGVPSSTYHREWLHAVNKSSLFKILDCPARYRCALDNSKEPTAEMALGSLTHTLTFEPEMFGEEFAVEPEINKRTKEGKEEAANFALVNRDRIIVTSEQLEQAGAMAEAVRSHDLAMEQITGCTFEDSIIFTDEQTGILCKVRPDGLRLGPNGVIVDLKTTRDLSKFQWDARDYGYLFQAAFYQYGVNVVTGELLPFKFVAVEKEPPYLVQVYTVSDNTMALAAVTVRQALDLLKYCREIDRWPGYRQEEVELDFEMLKGAHYEC